MSTPTIKPQFVQADRYTCNKSFVFDAVTFKSGDTFDLAKVSVSDRRLRQLWDHGMIKAYAPGALVRMADILLGKNKEAAPGGAGGDTLVA